MPARTEHNAAALPPTAAITQVSRSRQHETIATGRHQACRLSWPMLFPGGDFGNRGDLPMPETSTRSGPERIPVGPFLHYLMAECGVSPHTLAAYRSDLMRFVRWQKSEAPGPLASLDASDLSGYVEMLSLSGLAPSSVCRHLASLSTFFRFLVFEGRLPENVVKLSDRSLGLGSPADGALAGGGQASARFADERDSPGASRSRGPGNALRDRLPRF